jgi:SAM-dependent methyltransferase
MQRTKESYDRVASEYAHSYKDELEYKPLDRALLDCFAEQLRGKGKVADLGCGPGQIAAYLRQRGLDVIGVDLSEAMVEVGKQTFPGVEFCTGDMLALDVPSSSWAGIVAFYAIVHLSPEEVPIAARELHRVLAPGGSLLISFHVGEERVRLEEWYGQKVDLEWIFFSEKWVEEELVRAGFTIDASLVRAPYVPREHPTRRAYLWAHKP